jgi:outer membrane lipoprotein-sorting protein
MRVLHRASQLFLVCGCLIWLTACSASNPVSQARSQSTPSPQAKILGPGQQLLNQSARLLGSATTLHGLFTLTITGSLLKGELDDEIWRATPQKSRSLVLKSTLDLFPIGQLDIDNGQQLWQYEPARHVVYTGPDSSTDSELVLAGGQASDEQQVILTLALNIFEHSNATLVNENATVDGHSVEIIHISPQAGAGAATHFTYDGTVALDQQTHLPVELDLSLQGLGQVQLTVHSLELNQPLDPTLFAFTLPPGTTIEPFPSTSTGSSGNDLTLQQAQQQAGYHLLSIPNVQTAYTLQSLDALGIPGNQIYTLTYAFAGQTFTVSEGKALADLPLAGQSLSLRGTTAILATNGTTNTLSWTEHGIGVQISGTLKQAQLTSIANQLS